MMMDLTHFTYKELCDMQTICLEKICKMVADKETIELLAAIEKELNSRK
jgi:hypothetical protein